MTMGAAALWAGTLRLFGTDLARLGTLTGTVNNSMHLLNGISAHAKD